jgi:hypothetical protein
MGTIKKALPVKLISGLIYAEEEIVNNAKDRLMKRFGAIDSESRTIPFDFTIYYEEEMGKELKRRFISFASLIDIETLPEIKIFTNQVEEELCLPNTKKRRINIDPGYIAHEKLVLATTKNYDHRPYLQKGIYAELTYRFHQGNFQPLEWTYPDYKISESISTFNAMRKTYMEQLKAFKESKGLSQTTHPKEALS